MSATLFENWTKNPENLLSLRDAVDATMFDDDTLPKFLQFVNLMKVRSGDPIAILGEYEDVGLAGGGCSPTYTEGKIENSLKRWDLGDWQVAKKECYTAVEGTFAEYALHAGTQVANLTDTEIGTVYADRITRAIVRMIWRLGWFGDKEAKANTGGGVLTTDVDTKMFTVCNGLFKRIFTLLTTNTDQLVSIEANTKESYAEQKSTMFTEGAATKVMDDLLINADTRITSDPNATVMVTKAFADALKQDIKTKYKINMEWKTIFDGFDVAMYDGVKVARVSIWDRIIKAYENTGTKLNKPYRAVYTNPKNLLVGTNADGLLSDLEIWFEKKDRMNYWYAAGKMDTQLLEDDLIMAAY